MDTTSLAVDSKIQHHIDLLLSIPHVIVAIVNTRPWLDHEILLLVRILERQDSALDRDHHFGPPTLAMATLAPRQFHHRP